MSVYRYVTYLCKGDDAEDWRKDVGDGGAEITNDELADLTPEEIAEYDALRTTTTGPILSPDVREILR